MWRGDESEFFESSHFGTNRGTGDVKKFGESDTADRGSHLSVFLNDGKKDGFLAIGELNF